MNPTTDGDDGQMAAAPGRWCGDCGEALGDAAHLHDGDLVCPGCWYERRLAEEREHLEEAEAEVESVREEMEATEATFEAEMTELRRRRATWDRRAADGRKRIAALEAEEAEAEEAEEERCRRIAGLTPEEEARYLSSAPAPAPLEGLLPLAGGAPYEPTAEDWADYREWCAEVERRTFEAGMDRDEPEAPKWGYE